MRWSYTHGVSFKPLIGQTIGDFLDASPCCDACRPVNAAGDPHGPLIHRRDVAAVEPAASIDGIAEAYAIGVPDAYYASK